MAFDNSWDQEDAWWRENYGGRPYATGRNYEEFRPAYQYGYDTYGQYRGQRFEDVEDSLERNWDSTRANSRLGWSEAKGAVRDGWHYVERAMPGDADRDGR